MKRESDWDETLILDEEHLLGYTGGDSEFASEVLVIFAENAPSYLDALKSAETDGWRAAAHKLKGAARGIGAWRLARAAERAEFLGEPRPDDPKRQAALIALDDRYAELVAYVSSR